MDINKLLKKSDLFKNINDHSIHKIGEIGIVKSVNSNEMLFLDGESASSFYLLIDGAIKLYKSAPDGREIIVRLLEGGEIFGEVILFESNSYPVSAVAIKNSSVFEIQKKSFIKLLDNPQFRNEFIGDLMQKLRYLTRQVHSLNAYDVEERFFRFLLERHGRQNRYEINISKKDIAAAIGTIPETLSRLILRLTKRNIIKWNKNSLEITDGFWDANNYED